MWWTDGFRSDDGQLGAATVCKHIQEWKSHSSYLGAGHMEVIDAELWVIGLMLCVRMERSKTLPSPGVETVAVFSDSQAIIQPMALVELGSGQRVTQWID